MASHRVFGLPIVIVLAACAGASLDRGGAPPEMVALEVFRELCLDSVRTGDMLSARIVEPRSRDGSNQLAPGGVFAEVALLGAQDDGTLDFEVLRLLSLSHSMDLRTPGVSRPTDPDRGARCLPKRGRIYAALRRDLARFQNADRQGTAVVGRALQR